MLSEAGDMKVPPSFIGFVLDFSIAHLLKIDAWANEPQEEYIPTTDGGRIRLQTREYITYGLAIAKTIFTDAEIPLIDPLNTRTLVDFNFDFFCRALEEYVDIRLDLIRNNYRAVIDRFASRTEKDKKTREKINIIGRLDDPNYALFSNHYNTLAIEFLTTHTMPVDRWSKNAKDFQTLQNLFFQKF